MKTLRFLGKGIGHEDAGKECQDRLSVFVTADGRTICAVSDGCSSSACAAQAAQRNIDTVNRIFSRFRIKDLTRSGVVQMYPMLADRLKACAEDDLSLCFSNIFGFEMANLAKELQMQNAQPTDFYATLLFVVIEEENTFIGHIGDGNIILFDEAGKTVHHSKEDNGSDSTHTFFTVSPGFTEHFRHCIIPTGSFHSLILFSDGPQTMFRMEGGSIENGAYEIVVAPTVKNEIATEQELAGVLQKPLGNAMHYGFDDWSLIVAYKCAQPMENLAPVSIKELFMEEYVKLITPQPADKPSESPCIRPQADTQTADDPDRPDAPQEPTDGENETQQPAENGTSASPPADPSENEDAATVPVTHIPHPSDESDKKPKRSGFTFFKLF